jgi:thiol-disulfide isomerase/thioredoxin
MVTQRSYSIFTQLVFFFLLISKAEASLDLLQGKLEDLKSDGTIDLSIYKGKPTILTFFQPGCEGCHRLIKIFQCIDEKYPRKFNIIYLGTFADKSKLTKAIADFKIPYPTYLAGEAFMKNVGGIKYTPYTLITDENGNLKGKIGGGLPCKNLEKYLQTQKVI